jgi:Patatin-like phospholipase
LLLLSWPVPFTCWRTSAALAPVQVPAGAWLWPLGGFGAGLVTVSVIYVAQSWIPPLPALNGLTLLGPGYVLEPEPGQAVLAPGHGLATLNLFVVILIYVLSYWLAGPVSSEETGGTLPAIFYVLLVWVLLHLALSGMAFLLDYIRFPVTLAVAGLSLLLALVNRTDHVFQLARAEPAKDEPKNLRDLGGNWRIPKTAGKDGKESRTLVVVTAAGGGIQAAAWTARVLTGLEETYDKSFADSLRVVSAVSGGSVGTLFYLDGRANPSKVVENAEGSGLAATARGWAYPDLLRVILPALARRDWDRGSELEEVWRDRMAEKDKTLSQLVADLDTAGLPFPIFNATIAETGQRMLIAPALVDPNRQSQPDALHGDPSRGREWLELYPDFGGDQLYLSTAARLSATFPYVSPLARPLRPPGLTPAQQLQFDEVAYHYADGGYVDNEGMVSLIEAMQQLIEANQQKTGGLFDRILVLRIEPFPRDRKVEAAKLSRGWFYAVFGPLDALQNVRSASQVERNDLASRLFRDAVRARGIQVEFARLTFKAEKDYVPPLSWMLTDGQKKEIEEAWQHIKDHALKDIDKYFPRK